jgi:hypothetical protein
VDQSKEHITTNPGPDRLVEVSEMELPDFIAGMDTSDRIAFVGGLLGVLSLLVNLVMAKANREMAKAANEAIPLARQAISQSHDANEIAQEAKNDAREAYHKASEVGDSQIEMNDALLSANLQIHYASHEVLNEQVIDELDDTYRRLHSFHADKSIVKIYVWNEGLHAAYDIEPSIRPDSDLRSKYGFSNASLPAGAQHDFLFPIPAEASQNTNCPWKLNVHLSYRDGHGPDITGFKITFRRPMDEPSQYTGEIEEYDPCEDSPEFTPGL